MVSVVIHSEVRYVFGCHIRPPTFAMSSGFSSAFQLTTTPSFVQFLKAYPVSAVAMEPFGVPLTGLTISGLFVVLPCSALSARILFYCRIFSKAWDCIMRIFRELRDSSLPVSPDSSLTSAWLYPLAAAAFATGHPPVFPHRLLPLRCIMGYPYTASHTVLPSGPRFRSPHCRSL